MVRTQLSYDSCIYDFSKEWGGEFNEFMTFCIGGTREKMLEGQALPKCQQ